MIAFLKTLSVHAAMSTFPQADEEDLPKIAGRKLTRSRRCLSAVLASELGERVIGYVRGAMMKGRRPRPVSALLPYTG